MTEDRRKRVLVAVQFDIGYGRGVARGVIAYAHDHTNWRLWRSRAIDGDEIAATGTHGVIGSSMESSEQERTLGSALRIVLVGTSNANTHLSSVAVDDHAIGAMAGDYLFDRGVRNFAFVGSGEWPFVHRRLIGLNTALARKGMGPANTFIGSLYERSKRAQFEDSLEHWLRQLPFPCGVLAANDATGIEVVAAARRAGIRVPDDLAVVGVDDDELACELSEVPLSSVAQPVFALGYEAARLLHRLLEDPSRPVTNLVLPPVRVVSRASSDMVAIEDEDVAQALRMIRDHGTEPINVDWIIRKLPVARRSLERRFRHMTGRSLLEQIHHVRFEKARELLADTDLNLKTIAVQSGFGNLRSLVTAFRRRFGKSPGSMRSSLRSRKPSRQHSEEPPVEMT